MKAEFVNPFFKATNDVFNSMLDIEPMRGELGVVEDIVSGGKANVMIGVTGSLSGTVMYSFPEDMTLEIVKIMSGMEMDKLDSFVTSALGEVANIISGNAMNYLNQGDYECDIVPPQVIIGENQSISMATEKALTLPLMTDIGDFEINISIKEKNE